MKDTADICQLFRLVMAVAALHLLLGLTGIGALWGLVGTAYFVVAFAYVDLGIALHRRLNGSDGGFLYAA